jgi:hypothetical protein
VRFGLMKFLCVGVEESDPLSNSKPRPASRFLDLRALRPSLGEPERGLVLCKFRSSSDDCSSLAVVNDSARDEDRREGLSRGGIFNDAGGVASGVGGLRLLVGVLVLDGL